jgi:hypothetical protein
VAAETGVDIINQLYRIALIAPLPGVIITVPPFRIDFCMFIVMGTPAGSVRQHQSRYAL